MEENPFSLGTTSYHDFEILRDLQWHCTKCELKSGQAKTWQTWRDAYGIQFEESSPGSRRWETRIHCDTCDKTTVHRKLKSLARLEGTSARSGISPKVANRVKSLRRYQDAFLLRELHARELEVDHKFPQIRWNKDEEPNEDASDADLLAKFILLNRSNNLLNREPAKDVFIPVFEEISRAYIIGTKVTSNGEPVHTMRPVVSDAFGTIRINGDRS